MTRWKLFKKRECWVPTGRGWVLILFILSLSLALYTEGIHSFLAVSRPVRGQILIVEEWVPPYALEKAAHEFKAHNYKFLIITGDAKKWVINVLKSGGVGEEQIIRTHPKPAEKDRTFASAVAVRDWLVSSGVSDKSVDLFTLGAHARRSWLLYQTALGSNYTVGVISCEDNGYDPERWWRSSDGFKKIFGETFAYIYTRLIFLPTAPQ